VTAQKKEERIIDVPIAMSAFSAEALDDYKMEGGSELLRAVPNMNFSKGNFRA
jgi:outer membrane receptor protein involved in Fe transport